MGLASVYLQLSLAQFVSRFLSPKPVINSGLVILDLRVFALFLQENLMC